MDVQPREKKKKPLTALWEAHNTSYITTERVDCLRVSKTKYITLAKNTPTVAATHVTWQFGYERS